MRSPTPIIVFFLSAWILASTPAFAQITLGNPILPWSSRAGFCMGIMLDENSADFELRAVRMGLRTGWHAGFTMPLDAGKPRSPGLTGGFMFYPNPFHSRMDPFIHVRGHVVHEMGQFRAGVPGNEPMRDRPFAWVGRLQAGYGFNILLSKYLYIQHMLGIGYAMELYKVHPPLGKVTMMLNLGLGYNLHKRIMDHRRSKAKANLKTN